ncbi:phosphoglycerate mutase [Staphylothermus marinus F1]|uniref:Phosphoglycerate mutase n=1 Tax=Staphylothermus marinus (strain ATCC 43588 / DSM 3639 / JCM 9404 / F1) TaxID=399550 RepID=A3DLD4_STAMF|nr:2,3-bisphosphoglycerate-independent phosphoglycerate mutase [Staphylothermus marinus]ABN69444.1 phosphoglycerate mutase [Staphylothermus marinus F1]
MSVKKLLYLVLDGMADRLDDPATTLELAVKPGLDYIARNGVCGLMYTVGKGVAPESDEAVISILGYNPHEVYPGRGVIEAVGAGLSIREGYEVAFRANFATVDPKTKKLIDRRVGRSLSTEEANELAKAVDGLDLGKYDGYARVKATIGHRAVVVISSDKYRLSPYVSNSDPAYIRKGLLNIAVKEFEPYIKPVEALENTEEAKRTAELANIFTEKTIEILDKHPVNIKRKEKGLLPGNAILLRDAGGTLPKTTPLPIKYGLKFAVLAEMPVEIGIGRIFGADTIALEPPIGDPSEVYSVRLEKSLEALKKYDIVYVHLKGPDEPGHDGNIELKKKRIEDIDKYFVQPFLEKMSSNTAILVTADHATPPSIGAHTDDPVPVAVMAETIQPDQTTKLTEKECRKGKLGIIPHGWEMLPKIIKLLNQHT